MIKINSIFDKSKKFKFHDMMHGHGNLDKAINLLNLKERNDFKVYLEQSVSLILTTCLFVNQKNKKAYYESVFPC